MGVLTAHAAYGYWIDQYNALINLGALRLDSQLAEMRRAGANVVKVHADSHPDSLLDLITWSSLQAG